MTIPRTSLDVVVSVYNEEASLPAFHRAAVEALKALEPSGVDARIVYVNDGSVDRSSVLLDGFSSETNVTVIHLSRNFGHEAAMLAGLDHSSADYAVFLDADLQHPPGEIAGALERAKAGADIVMMRRAPNPSGAALRTALNVLFYRGLNYISGFAFEENASDFFLLSRPVVKILKTGFRERTRFLRGFVQWVGFRRAVVTFSAPPRFAGQSKYSFRHLVRLAKNAALSFSSTPLRISFAASFLFILFSLTVAIFSTAMWLRGSPPSGYTTLIVFGSITAATIFGLLGIQGEYIAQLIDESKARPLYIVARTVGESSTVPSPHP